MKNSDYIIAFDENGQLYISHGVGRSVRTIHKYIKKIGEGSNARYFYTQDELRGFYNKDNSVNSDKFVNTGPAKNNDFSLKTMAMLNRHGSDSFDKMRKEEVKIKKTKDAIAKTEFGEYRKNDTDFDEKHYSEENWIEDSDFYAFQRDDGRYVVLEEDMKWVLPEGMDPKSSKVKELMRQFSDPKELKKIFGTTRYSNEDYVNAFTKALDSIYEVNNSQEFNRKDSISITKNKIRR